MTEDKIMSVSRYLKCLAILGSKNTIVKEDRSFVNNYISQLESQWYTKKNKQEIDEINKLYKLYFSSKIIKNNEIITILAKLYSNFKNTEYPGGITSDHYVGMLIGEKTLSIVKNFKVFKRAGDKYQEISIISRYTESNKYTFQLAYLYLKAKKKTKTPIFKHIAKFVSATDIPKDYSAKEKKSILELYTQYKNTRIRGLSDYESHNHGIINIPGFRMSYSYSSIIAIENNTYSFFDTNLSKTSSMHLHQSNYLNKNDLTEDDSIFNLYIVSILKKTL